MVWAMTLVVAACGSSSQPSSSGSPSPSAGPPSAPPRPALVAGKLLDTSSDAADAVTMQYSGKGVSLADLPAVAERIGLPVSGKADFSIDIIVPKTKGVADYTKATGRIELACTKCQIGDDAAKLQLASKSARTNAFAGDGIPFGHLAIDSFEAKLDIIGGKLELTSWKLASPDLEMQTTLAVTFAKSLDLSAVEGCMRYKPSAELAKRDQKTHDMLALTGAMRGSDGFDQIALQGTVAQLRKLARDCDGVIASAP